MERNYKNSPHKWTYIWIALKHFTTPTRVYKLAHGILEMHKKDRSIMHDLKEYDIIHHKKGYQGGK
ncbi:MAG: hypothetical protein K6E54_08980 [Bacteroidaceae bacterium]|nr:hypothetical protein [Bacteroidaceae bacterium]